MVGERSGVLLFFIMNANATLLHTCCGPCASACVPVLKDEGRSVVLYFANSNIDTKEEWTRRLEAARQLADAEGVELIVEPYDHAEWLACVARGFEGEPEKGARCERCYRYNLLKAARYAVAHGLTEVTTSLTISPHKPSPVVFAMGRAAADSVGVSFLSRDFKKKDGFKKSVARAKELGLYRQPYCGCEFSRRG